MIISTFKLVISTIKISIQLYIEIGEEHIIISTKKRNPKFLLFGLVTFSKVDMEYG